MGKRKGRILSTLLLSGLVLASSLLADLPAGAATQQQSGSVGIEGTIGGAAPAQAPTITLPKDGQGFSSLPITVSGLCQSGLLVEIFSNGVFIGSVVCTNSSFSLQTDLFSGRNDLIARQYDALNQASPDSATVTVTFTSGQSTNGSQLTLTTQYATRGADPNTVLSWPLTISGGQGPYAISVDWGDKTPLDLLSRVAAGDFSINHTYTQAGRYSVTVKASDAAGNTAFLQVVAIANGPIQQNGASGNNKSTVIIERVIIWWPIVLAFLLAISAFWLGKKHQLEIIRSRIRRGERPF